jgi:protein gp37
MSIDPAQPMVRGATWNPMTGCTKITAGCGRSYAARSAERFRKSRDIPYEPGVDLTLRPERLKQPLGCKRSRMIFVDSMSDLFHKDIPPAHIDQMFDTMEAAHWHCFQVTKRGSLMHDYARDRYRRRSPPAHIWLRVSVEDAALKSRIEHLRPTPAAVRFLSTEPMLGPLGSVDFTGIHRVLLGGETGPGTRPIDIAWVSEIRVQCVAQLVAFYFERWGGSRPKTTGMSLDGREWKECPRMPIAEKVAA